MARMLIVDDDETRRAMLARVFEHEGYEVQVLPDGQQLLRCVGEFHPDAVLLDCMLPHTSGFELCSDLRMLDTSRTLAILLITSAHMDEESVVRGLLAGADDYIVMPGRLSELRARVRVQLRNRRDRELLKWAQDERSAYKTAALTDPLTGLANRRAVDRVLHDALVGDRPVILVAIDIDHFKRLNDNYGHAAGDEVLKAVAASIRRRTRSGDLAARVGGEEFLVVIRGARPEFAASIGERYRRGIADVRVSSVIYDGSVTASVGVSYWDGVVSAPPAIKLWKRADEALYQAKGNGRNRVELVRTPIAATSVELETLVTQASR